MGSLTPTFLLAALGLEAWWMALRRAPLGRAWAFLGVLAFIAYGAWNAYTMDYRCHTGILAYKLPNYILYQDMRKLAPTHRIYLMEDDTGSTSYSLGTLADKHFDLYRMDMDGSAPVAAPINGKTPDVALYFSPRHKATPERLTRDFPKARLEFFPWRGDGPNPTLRTLARALIPGDTIPYWKNPAKPPLLYRSDIPAQAWHRIIFQVHAGLGMGAINSEDHVTQLLAPLPVMHHLMPRWAEARFFAPRAGYYRLSTATANYAVLDIDGHGPVLSLKPDGSIVESREGSIRLRAGMHRLRLRTYFQSNFSFPDIRVYYPGQAASVPLELPPSTTSRIPNPGST